MTITTDAVAKFTDEAGRLSALIKTKDNDILTFMKIRTIYFKVSDMQAAVAFWKSFLGIEPHKQFDEWHEFMLENIRLGLLLNTEDLVNGSNCVPVFEFADDEVLSYTEKAKNLGAKVIVDGMDDPKLLSVVFADPWGNEFEVSKFHH